jgi:hypothetical protein
MLITTAEPFHPQRVGGAGVELSTFAKGGAQQSQISDKNAHCFRQGGVRAPFLILAQVSDLTLAIF